ncbi:MAG: TIM barrel protein [Lachnospiraceae bacterium]|nr:TIM barrel protein [Lachnospiraceae bacterium]
MNLSVCIDLMYTYCDFYERFAEAAADGIKTVEFWKWSNKDLDRVCALLQENGQQVSIFNIDCQDEQLSYDLSRGILNDGRADEFLRALIESIPVYKRLNAKAMIVLIGEHKPYNEENVYKCLEAAKPILEKENVNLIVEPLNATDRVGYSMPYAAPVLALIQKLNSPHIRMLYDIYHQNMTGDFDLEEVRKNIGLIGHFHVADVPGRHEPGTGNVDYVSILKQIDAIYDGFVGLEYRATKKDGETYGFLKEAGYGL